MKRAEMKEVAEKLVAGKNSGSTGHNVHRTYKNIMDGTLMTVKFKTKEGEEIQNVVYFGPDEEPEIYRWSGDVIADIAFSERVKFFRLIELAGVGGVIAFFLIIVFTTLLCVLAFFPTSNSTVLEVVKTSFTIILGFFFGSQTAGKKSA